jgi:hypothetical protein
MVYAANDRTQSISSSDRIGSAYNSNSDHHQISTQKLGAVRIMQKNIVYVIGLSP